MTHADAQQPLWRYMKLSTFLLLMEGKAWFPSVASLRAGDPLEGGLGNDFHAYLWGAIHKTGEIERVKQWLLDSLPDKDRQWLEKTNPDSPTLQAQVLAGAYADQVAARIAVWCWFESDIESAAMWSVYGHQGVAVRTTRMLLKEALPPMKQFGIQTMTYRDRRLCADQSLTSIISEDSSLMLRPHFLKAIEYEHEKEVRVAAFCPRGAKGLMVTGIKSQSMVLEVVTSPLLPLAEAKAIQRLVAETLDNSSLSFRQSNLRLDGITFVNRLEEAFHGDRDDNIDLSDLPAFLKTL